MSFDDTNCPQCLESWAEHSPKQAFDCGKDAMAIQERNRTAHEPVCSGVGADPPAGWRYIDPTGRATGASCPVCGAWCSLDDAGLIVRHRDTR